MTSTRTHGTPPVYAVIVNYNGCRDTIECLESLIRSDYAPLRVLVCDNASSDNSIESISAWARGETQPTMPREGRLAHLSQPPIPKPLRVAVCGDDELAQPDADRDAATLILVRCRSNLGFAGANNVALKYLLTREVGAYALLFNNDAVIAPDAVRVMVEHAERRANLGALGATVLRYYRPDRVETLAGARFNRLHGMVEWNHVDAFHGDPRPDAVDIDFVAGCCLLIPRSTVERVGFMDERYFLYGEDADWCLRMTQAGLALAYSPAAEMWHKGGGSVVHRSALHDYYAVRATLMVLHRHFPMTLVLALPHAILRFLLPKLVRGEWQRLRSAARGYRDFIRVAVRS